MRALLNQEVEIEELFEYKENDESDQEFLEKSMKQVFLFYNNGF